MRAGVKQNGSPGKLKQTAVRTNLNPLHCPPRLVKTYYPSLNHLPQNEDTGCGRRRLIGDPGLIARHLWQEARKDLNISTLIHLT